MNGSISQNLYQRFRDFKTIGCFIPLQRTALSRACGERLAGADRIISPISMGTSGSGLSGTVSSVVRVNVGLPAFQRTDHFPVGEAFNFSEQEPGGTDPPEKSRRIHDQRKVSLGVSCVPAIQGV